VFYTIEENYNDMKFGWGRRGKHRELYRASLLANRIYKDHRRSKGYIIKVAF